MCKCRFGASTCIGATNQGQRADRAVWPSSEAKFLDDVK